MSAVYKKYEGEMHEKIRTTYKNLKSIYKSARILGINYKTVSRHAKDLIPDKMRKGSRIRYSEKIKEQAKKLYKRLGSTDKVAKILNVPKWTVYEWVKGLVKKHSNYGKFKYDKEEARKLYKQVGSTYLVAEKFGVSPTNVGKWVKDLIPIAKTKYERKVARILDAAKVPYDKVVVQGKSRNYTPDFVIPPQNPKIFIEVKENNRKDYQQWHRICLLSSKEMAFDVVDVKIKYPDIKAVAVINKKWNKPSMKVLETYFDRVFINENLSELTTYVKQIVNRK